MRGLGGAETALAPRRGCGYSLQLVADVPMGHQGTITRNIPDAQGFNSFGYPDRSDGINTLERPGLSNRDSSTIKGRAISER